MLCQKVSTHKMRQIRQYENMTNTDVMAELKKHFLIRCLYYLQNKDKNPSKNIPINFLEINLNNF